MPGMVLGEKRNVNKTNSWLHRVGILVEVLPPKWLCQTQGCVMVTVLC